MHSRLEKPIIREERAETSAAAFIKFAFSIARSNKWETQERVLEEERLIFNLSLKRGSLKKYKDYSDDFSKFKLASKNPRTGNRRWISPETESVLTWKTGERQPLFLAVLKFLVEVSFENGAFRVRHYCFHPTLQ